MAKKQKERAAPEGWKVKKMRKVAVTQLFNCEEEIYFNEYADGSYKKVVDEIETDSSLDELQKLINTGKYEVTELTF